MGTGVRFYLHETSGEMRRISQRLATDLRNGRATLPAYAGTRQQVIVIEVEFIEGSPKSLLTVQGEIWSFDADGSTAASMRRELNARIDLLPGALGSMPAGVLDARQAISRKRLQVETRWDVPQAVIQRIAENLGLA